MTERKWQDQEAITEGLPPVMNASYDDPKVRKVYPFADLLREQLKDSVDAPETPAYSDVTLAVQQTLHPPAKIDPQTAINTLQGPPEHPRRRRAVLMAVAATVGPRPAPPPRRRRSGLTERAKAERKLAWMLCAPAVVVMLLVAGFPIVYAFWLSLRRSDLRFPDAGEFVGLSELRDRAARRAPGGTTSATR